METLEKESADKSSESELKLSASDSETPQLICFVCTGNTCRSPMAAAVLNYLGKGRYVAVSAGIAAIDGDGISENAVTALQNAGIESTPENDYRSHRARKITRSMIAHCDRVVAISSRHMLCLISAFPEYAGKISVFPHDIPDPFMGDVAEYGKCLEMMVSDIKAMFLSERDGEYRVRVGTKSDVRRILEIENEAFTDPWTEEMLNSCFEPYTDLWVLENSACEVCGFAVLDRTLVKEAELHNIAIAKELRGKGLSALLMDKLIERAKERGVHRIMLEVRVSNAPAIALYQKYGFEKVGLRPAYYRKPTENALLMDLVFDNASDN